MLTSSKVFSFGVLAVQLQASGMQVPRQQVEGCVLHIFSPENGAGSATDSQSAHGCEGCGVQ